MNLTYPNSVGTRGICLLGAVWSAVLLVSGVQSGRAQPSLDMLHIHNEAQMRYLDNGTIKIGINLSLGGAITYLARSEKAAPNLVNSFDWGRQIQMSNYSGPVPFAPPPKKPRPDWAGLGWNPIQSGDCYGNQSKVTQFRTNGKVMTVRCIPMQWPLNNEPGECEFECRISLDGSAAHVDCMVENHRADHTQYDARDQELPAIYTNGPWYRLMTYEGDVPFTRDALTQAPAAFPWTGWKATENWAALVDDQGFGVGIYEPGVTRFIGGFAGKPGKGGPDDSPTGYIAPLHVEILDYNITYHYSYSLIVGDIDSIRNWVYDHAPRAEVPNYVFTRDRQHWHYVNATDSGWPIKGQLSVNLSRSNPQLIAPQGFWHADAAPTLYLNAKLPAGIVSVRVFWSRPDSPGFTEKCVQKFPVTGNGEFHEYKLDLSHNPEYRGAITGLRIDPETAGIPDGVAGIRSIGFR